MITPAKRSSPDQDNDTNESADGAAKCVFDFLEFLFLLCDDSTLDDEDTILPIIGKSPTAINGSWVFLLLLEVAFDTEYPLISFVFPAFIPTPSFQRKSLTPE
jgi:hypothetical protein